jgi:flagellar hook-associated protein 1
MSINAIMGGALSGIHASQAGLRATSNNVANVNTEGYARQSVSFSGRSVSGVSAGVEIDAIRRVTDRFLASASLSATSRSAAAGVTAEFLDRAQAFYGDPANGNSIFDDIDRVFASFAELTTEPTSSVRRSDAIADLETLLNQFQLMSGQLQDLRSEADRRLGESVEEADRLIGAIAEHNVAVMRARVTGDASGAENDRDMAIKQLSTLMDISVSENAEGIVEVRSASGVLLAGQERSTLSYAPKGAAAPGASFDEVTVQTPAGTQRSLESLLQGGEIKALISLRDQSLVDLTMQLGELAAHTADVINAAHNQSTSFPPPARLSGQPTHFLATDQLQVAGVAPAQTQVVLMDADGRWQDTLTIDFTNGNVTRQSDGAVQNFTSNTVGGMSDALNASLAATGAGGQASFANGSLTLQAGGALRLAVVDQDSPATIGGKSFSHAFRLNDLITHPGPLSFDTGLSAASPHGLGTLPGEEISFRFTDSNGVDRRFATVAPVAGQNISQLLAQLNDPVTGLGSVGTFSAPDAGGRITFSANANFPGGQLTVESDSTLRAGSNGVSFSQLFGLGEAPVSSRSSGLAVRGDIRATPASISLSRVDLDGRVTGDFVTGLGDGSGADLLFKAAGETRTFWRPDGTTTVTTTLRNFASQTGAEAGRLAGAAQSVQNSADTLARDASERLASVEGVNIDEELVRLTTYQQAYNANSRMLQAASEMLDTLLSIV